MFPEAYLQAARTQKDRELATIYAIYQTKMQELRLVDREGERVEPIGPVERNGGDGAVGVQLVAKRFRANRHVSAPPFRERPQSCGPTMTAVASISTIAAGSTSRDTSTRVIAG